MSFPRYPEYKETGIEWLGQIPKHWDVVRLKNLIKIQNGADHKPVEVADGYPVYGSGGVFAYASEYAYDGESVLLGRKGTIDKPIYVNGPFWTVDTMYWSRILDDVSARFVYFTATAIPFRLYSTNTALPSMTQEALNNHAIARPHPEEQRAIAAFLDHETAKIDALVAEQEQLIALLKEKRQAVISHAVTKGLNPDAPMKDSGIEWIGEIPEHWGVAKLGSMARVLAGYSFSSADFELEGVPVIRMSDFGDGRVYREGAKCVSEARVPPMSYAEERDILLGLSGSVSNFATVSFNDLPIAINQRVGIVRSPDYAEWLEIFLQTAAFLEQITSQLPETTIANISMADLRNVRVPVPPLDECALVASMTRANVLTMNNFIAEAERGIELLQERRTALISAAVTGQIDVRGWAERSAS